MKQAFRIILMVFVLGSIILPLRSICHAGEADVLAVKIDRTEDGYLNVWVTVRHDDEGWKHYVDRWEILAMDGTVLDTRILQHPHSKAPFTRSLPRARIPAGTKEIRVRAHDSIHGFGGKEMVVRLDRN